MTDDAHASGGPPLYVQDGARTPTHGERARTLVTGHGDATLSTLSLDPTGYPFGSVVTYALDAVGSPLLLMSTMAEHARNLAEDPRASVLVTASGDGAGRLAAARATLLGTLRPVTADDREAATETYRSVHPGAFWIDFDDFFVARLEIERIRYVRGFGEMSWVDVDSYSRAEPDPVAPTESQIVAHMNEDHADALATIVGHALPLADLGSVRMLSCDRYGFEVEMRDGEHDLAFGRLGFDEVLGAAGEARGAMVTLSRRARADGGEHAEV